MSEQARYYGVPREERPAREKTREKEIFEELDAADRDGLRLPDAFRPMAAEAAEAVARLARRHGVVPPAPNLERIFFVPDPNYRETASTAGTFSSATGIIELRLSELFDVSEEETGALWTELQRLVRESYERMCDEEFDALSAQPFDTRASSALMALYTVDELSRLLWKKRTSIESVRRAVEARISERASDPRVATFFRETVAGLFAPNPAYDAYDFIRLAPTPRERVARQVLLQGRISRFVAGNRAVRHALETAQASEAGAVRKTLTHEMAHAMAKNFIAEYPLGQVSTRSGYDLPSRRHDKNVFVSLNEACTEIIARRALAEDPDAVRGFEGFGSYANDRLLLGAIIAGIARRNNESESSAWNRFERGYFTGETMLLRDIERTFGRDAWEWYKLLSPERLKKPSRETRAKAKRYFGVEFPRAA